MTLDIPALLTVVAQATQTTHIVVNGETMAPLLPKTVQQLHEFWRQGLSAVALRNGTVVGHAAVEPLIDGWHELGVVWTDPRLRTHGGPHHHVGLRLVQALLARHREKNIIMTTVNGAMMTVGWRVGMVPLRYEQLPDAVWRATCCCPAQKTGTANNAKCKLRQETCYLQVTRGTWERMGNPEPCTLPVPKPTTPVTLPNDDIIILVAE